MLAFLTHVVPAHAQVHLRWTSIHHSVGSQWVLVHLVGKRLLDIRSQTVGLRGIFKPSASDTKHRSCTFTTVKVPTYLQYVSCWDHLPPSHSHTSPQSSVRLDHLSAWKESVLSCRKKLAINKWYSFDSRSNKFSFNTFSNVWCCRLAEYLLVCFEIWTLITSN